MTKVAQSDCQTKWAAGPHSRQFLPNAYQCVAFAGEHHATSGVRQLSTASVAAAGSGSRSTASSGGSIALAPTAAGHEPDGGASILEWDKQQ